MLKTKYQTTPKILSSIAKEEKKTTQIKAKEFNVMNAKDLDTFMWNVPISLKKQKKGHISTLLGEELEEDSDGEKANNMVVFIIHVISKSNDHDVGESCDEDLLYEDVVEAYMLLYLKWK